jgi:hypothetical protein
MSEIIDDLIVLGRAVPERLKDGRATVCLGGFSPSKGFIRIYPTRLRMNVSRWDIIRVKVERNRQDTRAESWKIVGSNRDWDRLYEKVEKVGRVSSAWKRRQIVTSNLTGCVNDLNSSQLSLGIIRPKVIKLYFGKNPQYGKPLQIPLPTMDAEDWARIKHDYELEPRIKYQCPACKAAQGFHDQKILEWGFYEWMRKNPDNYEQVFENARFYSPKHEVYLFVGNQAHRRTSYLVISTLPIQKDPELPRARC